MLLKKIELLSRQKEVRVRKRFLTGANTIAYRVG
jgi:hypothetical protein